jgi:hypothetical protein
VTLTSSATDVPVVVGAPPITLTWSSTYAT